MIVILIVVLVSVAMVPTTSGQFLPGMTIQETLSTQPCSQFQVEILGDRLRIQFNGTRVTFTAAAIDGNGWDESEKMVFQFVSLSEYATLQTYCLPNQDPLLRTVNFADCNCELMQLEETRGNITETGYQVKMDGCLPPDDNLVAYATVTVANDSYTETFGPTLPGSIAPNISYHHPYVRTHHE